MELHFPEVITFKGQPIPEAEMLKWLIDAICIILTEL